jgi:hypothetical protein
MAATWGGGVMTSYTHANCTICGKHHYCMPLHGDKGGPLCCLLCAGTWNAEHGRKRRLGRIVVRALAAFFAGGGQRRDVHKLELSAIGLEFGVSDMVDPLGCLSSSDTADADIELTSELLKDVLRLRHPDHHPLERQPLAQNVTQQLLKLQPFVFQAVKPEPKAERSREPADVTDKKNAHGRMINSRNAFPCKDCTNEVPLYYCTACRAEWDKRQRIEWEKEAAKRRAWYARRAAERKRARPPTTCATCQRKFKGKRTDARFCSNACRQSAHRSDQQTKRRSVGDPQGAAGEHPTHQESRVIA